MTRHDHSARKTGKGVKRDIELSRAVLLLLLLYSHGHFTMTRTASPTTSYIGIASEPSRTQLSRPARDGNSKVRHDPCDGATEQRLRVACMSRRSYEPTIAIAPWRC